MEIKHITFPRQAGKTNAFMLEARDLFEFPDGNIMCFARRETIKENVNEFYNLFSDKVYGSSINFFSNSLLIHLNQYEILFNPHGYLTRQTFLGRKFKYLLIDDFEEVQDTFELLKPVIMPCMVPDSKIITFGTFNYLQNENVV